MHLAVASPGSDPVPLLPDPATVCGLGYPLGFPAGQKLTRQVDALVASGAEGERQIRVSVPFSDVAPGGTQPPHHLAGLMAALVTDPTSPPPLLKSVLRESRVVPDVPEVLAATESPSRRVRFEVTEHREEAPEARRKARLDRSLPHGTWTTPPPRRTSLSRSELLPQGHLSLHIHKYVKQPSNEDESVTGKDVQLDWRAALQGWRGELNLHKRREV